MPEQQAPNGKPFDPVESFREVRDNYLDSWAKVMIDVVNTDAYARATGSMLETALSMSAPFRTAVEKAMLQTLQQLSMPSRNDFVSLAQRVSNVELKLDDVDAKLDRIEKLLTKGPAAQRTRPATRARRPPARAEERKG
ncbi:MAG TPA: hypothetical protein VMB18_15030 [Terriglobales bacterium]|jgi:hypothetical protein|nr:hypothetical protein [Terriglobales bacterium]